MPLTRRDFLKLLGAAAAVPLAARWMKPTPQTWGLPNVLILVFDTLSARHMSLYGYPRQTTPNLQRFAQISTVYHNHWATGNFTMPGTGSLLTGVYPWKHRGLHLFNARMDETYARHNLFTLLAPAQNWLTYTHNPIAMDLIFQTTGQLRQFEQAAETFLGNDLFSYRAFGKDISTAFWAERMTTNLDFAGSPGALLYSTAQNFWHITQVEPALNAYKAAYPRGVPTNLNGLFFLVEDALDWVAAQFQQAQSPLRAYIHLLPPHEPYTPRREFIGMFSDTLRPPHKPRHVFDEGYSDAFLETQRLQYDEFVAYTDAEFGRFLDFLQTSGRLEDTLIVFTSDHGQLFERGIHAHVTPTLYEGLLHIPLMIHTPAQKTRGDVYTPTSAVDVLPTVAALLGAESPEWVEGVALTPTHPPCPPSLPQNRGEKGEQNSRRLNFERYIAQNSTVKSMPPSPRLGEGGRGMGIFAVEAKESSKWSRLPKATFALRMDDYKLIHSRGYLQLPEGWELYNLKNDPEELDNRFDSDSIAKDLQTHLRDTLYQKGLLE